MIPVLILTGFLGSGKTTILRTLLTRPEMAGTAVIVNEFGEIGIDHLLLDTQVFEPVLLPNGCLCCTSRGQLVTTLSELAGNAAFSGIVRVVVETTGLANPLPLLRALANDGGLSQSFRLGGVITTVDCVNGLRTLARFDEAVYQVAVADRVLITKTDLASEADRNALRSHLVEINPGVRTMDIVAGQIAPGDIDELTLHDALVREGGLRRWIGAVEGESAASSHEHSVAVTTFNVVRDRPVRWASFSRWIDLVAAARGDDLLRVKGILNIAECPDEPVVIHGVQEVLHPPVRLARWPDDDRRTRLVFITRSFARKSIEATLHFLEN